MLNAAGFPDTSIVLSNDLDEMIIWQIMTQINAEAPRYGVDPAALIGRLVYGVWLMPEAEACDVPVIVEPDRTKG